jgi:hypothetical protein
MFNKIFFLRVKHEPSKKSGPSCDHWQPHQPVDLLGGTAPGWSLRSHHLPACLPGNVFAIISQWIYWAGPILGGGCTAIIYCTSLPSRYSLHNYQPVNLLGRTAPGWSLHSHHLPACLPGIVFTIINQWIYLVGLLLGGVCAAIRYRLHNHCLVFAQNMTKTMHSGWG